MDSSYVTSADIQEMEQVRQHLHIMLQNCKGFSDQPDYNQAPSSTTGEFYFPIGLDGPRWDVLMPPEIPGGT